MAVEGEIPVPVEGEVSANSIKVGEDEGVVTNAVLNTCSTCSTPQSPFISISSRVALRNSTNANNTSIEQIASLAAYRICKVRGGDVVVLVIYIQGYSKIYLL